MEKQDICYRFLPVEYSEFFALLKCQIEFFQIFALPVGSIGRAALFSGKRKEFFPRFGTAFALYVGRDQKDPGLFEKN